MTPDAARALLTERPARVVGALILAQLTLWTLLPLLTHLNAPLDIIEGLTWGREWQLGYAKHPPLQAWLLEGAVALFGVTLWPFYLLSQIALALTYWGVFRLGCRLTTADRAAVATLLSAGVYYFTLPTPEFNPNVLQMPVWVWLAYFGHRALREGGASAWVAVGLLAALGIYAKYSSGLIILALLLFALWEPAARRAFRTPGPWLAVAAGLLALAPHLMWLVEYDFLTFQYLARRSSAVAEWSNHLRHPLKFASAQLLAHLPLMLVLLSLLGWCGWRSGDRAAVVTDRLDRRYLLALGLGPLAIALALSAATGMKLRSMWGMPMFCFSGLLVVIWLRLDPTQLNVRRLLRATAVVLLVMGGLYTTIQGVRATNDDMKARSPYHGELVAERLTEEWRAATGTPLRYVIGDMWFGGNVGLYSPERPSVVIEGDLKRSFWVDPAELARHGALIVWLDVAGDGALPAAYRERYPAARPMGVIRFPWRTPFNKPPVPVGWGILPPASPE